MPQKSDTISPTILFLFGATGDLVAKKIVPALFQLFQKKKLPEAFRVIGVSRRLINDAQFREKIGTMLGSEQHAAQSGGFIELFSFAQLQFEQEAQYRELAASVDPHANRLVYLAVPPEQYPVILSHLGSSELIRRQTPRLAPLIRGDVWHRLIVEKPFGLNATHAEDIETQLDSLLDESQIYRIDHYLAKDLLQNIMNFRFSNALFEDNWNARNIESIHLRLWETIGVEHRGAFYDRVGALRDVAQNHLLQMLALVTMDRPASFSATDLRAMRAELLTHLLIPNEEEIRWHTFRAQYDGYRDIAGVHSHSETETYCAIRAFLESPRWRGIPITMEAGKRLHEQRKEIVVQFRAPYRNSILFSLEPTEGITIHFWSKKAGLDTELEKRSFDFVLQTASSRAQYIAEYEKLLLDSILGDQSLFVSAEETRAMWRFIDPIVNAWQKQISPLGRYAPGTDVSQQAASVMEQRTRSHELTGVILPAVEHVARESNAKFQLAILGLGKMGANMARRMVEKGWRVVGWNRTRAVTEALRQEGIEPAASFRDVVAALSAPRVIWLMLPAGAPVDEALFGHEGLAPLLSPGDTVIDGGNSYFKDAPRRAEKLREQGIQFLDVGTSGGPQGARTGACLMIGGDRQVFQALEPLFRDAACEGGVQFFDGEGAGHFVKMIHNGIEYGMMQAIAEGFEILKRSEYRLDLTRVAEIYTHGSVIESRLVSWLLNAFRVYGDDLKEISSTVSHTGEGAWTVETAREMGIEAKIIQGALEFRALSEKNPRYAGKVVSALRGQFGGHAVLDGGGVEPLST